jgi:UDP-N-acetylglucosamine--N-acetylmuramyl-(pentapeptide) pyrophosphoryl-undecaprenol N-acetylglucosamine transferase
VEVCFATDRKFAKIVQKSLDSEGLTQVKLVQVSAGKFRRYSHFKAIDYLKHPSIMLANLWDLLKVAVGVLQSQCLLIRFKPNVVFIKGGFVGLPVGLAAGLLWPRVPIVIHDSDTAPGLTNRVLSRFATKIATGMPLENYNYPAEKSAYTGIPIASLRPASVEQQAKLKAKWGFDAKKPLLVVTGGGLGSQRINDAVMSQLSELLKHTQVALVAGKDQYPKLAKREQPTGFKLYEFITSGFDELLGAADIVVSRAGATTIVELAALAKAVILVPNAMLPSSHQVKNAKALTDADAAVTLNDDRLVDRPQMLTTMVEELLGSDERLFELGRNLHKFAKPHAARDLARIIERAAK